MSADFTTIIPPSNLAKGAGFIEPMVEEVPIDLLIGQTHFIVNELNRLDGLNERYTCPSNLNDRFYFYGMGLEYKDMP